MLVRQSAGRSIDPSGLRGLVHYGILNFVDCCESQVASRACGPGSTSQLDLAARSQRRKVADSLSNA